MRFHKIKEAINNKKTTTIFYEDLQEKIKDNINYIFLVFTSIIMFVLGVLICIQSLEIFMTLYYKNMSSYQLFQTTIISLFGFSIGLVLELPLNYLLFFKSIDNNQK